MVTSVHLSSHLLDQCSHPPSWRHIHSHLLVSPAWGPVPTSHGRIPVQGSILTNLGFHPHPRFCRHLWSMTTLLLPPGGLLVGVVSMRGKGHWLGVGGSVRVYRSS